MICDNCQSKNVKKESNSIIYGKNYGNGICFYCHNCKASVGAHDNGKALGTLATKDVQILRKACHEIFDKLWKYDKVASRSYLYIRLASEMELDKDECHFGMFQRDKCLKALEVITSKEWWKTHNC